jgi:large subunit ribosomal protein L15
MQLHNLKRNKANKKARQVGRGGTRGKTSGKGTKGQNARSGRKKRPEMRDIIKRIPKLRGRGKNFLKTITKVTKTVNLSDLESKFNNGDIVTLSSLMEKGLVQKTNKNAKILSNGAITKSVTIKGVSISKGAEEAIKKAGGSIDI